MGSIDMNDGIIKELEDALSGICANILSCAS